MKDLERFKISKTAQAHFFRYFYIELLILWLIFFGIEALGITSWVSQLEQSTEKLNGYAAALSHETESMKNLAQQIRSQSKDLALLQDLPNVMPKDKGYVRTQKAISEDVEKLRHKIAQRLKGSLHIIVDAKANKFYLKKGLSIIFQADCSVGRGGTLIDKKTGRRWEFVTPRGEFKVLGKNENPVWQKPDWAFVESNESVPPPEDPKRKVEGELGSYVLNLGDGYLIHGTKNEQLLGRAVSHGCVRLSAKDLKTVYEMVPVGTRVFIVY